MTKNKQKINIIKYLFKIMFSSFFQPSEIDRKLLNTCLKLSKENELLKAQILTLQILLQIDNANDTTTLENIIKEFTN